MTGAHGRTLMQLYQEKLRLFKSLEILSRQCTTITVDYTKVADTGITRLQALLDERAQVIAEIDALDRQIAAVDVVEKDKSRLSQLRAEIVRVAERIQRMDARLQKILERETGMLREAVQNEQRQQRFARTYQRRSEAGEGFFVDKRT